MADMMGYCGYNCSECAARSEDPAVRQKLIDRWGEHSGHENYTVENVKCDGCHSNGNFAHKDCQVRICAIERKIESCSLSKRGN